MEQLIKFLHQICLKETRSNDFLNTKFQRGSRYTLEHLLKKKRVLENQVCDILENSGFEEILTPNFHIPQHQAIANETV